MWPRFMKVMPDWLDLLEEDPVKTAFIHKGIFKSAFQNPCFFKVKIYNKIQ